MHSTSEHIYRTWTFMPITEVTVCHISVVEKYPHKLWSDDSSSRQLMMPCPLLFPSLLRRPSSLVHHVRRSLCHDSPSVISVAQLNSRGLLRLQGKECCEFLQGLITNDIRHLEPQSSPHEQSVTRSSLFAFLLNPSGRIIADVLIYQRSSGDLLLECDKDLLSVVRGHLIAHRLRKKISIEETNEFKVWSLFSQSLIPRVKLKDVSTTTISVAESVVADISSCPLIVNDSRLPIALYRMISDWNQDWSSIQTTGVSHRLQSSSQDFCFNVTSEEDYRRFRYRIAVSEGSSDHTPHSALPLESNGDLLHAISFFKGCYIGQELTARSYHTGVIRKRLMPVLLTSDQVPDSWTPGSEFRTKEGKKLLGKVRSVSGKYGLALLYTEQVKKLDYCLELEDGSPVKSHVPFWWPAEEAKT